MSGARRRPADQPWGQRPPVPSSSPAADCVEHDWQSGQVEPDQWPREVRCSRCGWTTRLIEPADWLWLRWPIDRDQGRTLITMAGGVEQAEALLGALDGALPSDQLFDLAYAALRVGAAQAE